MDLCRNLLTDVAKPRSVTAKSRGLQRGASDLVVRVLLGPQVDHPCPALHPLSDSVAAHVGRVGLIDWGRCAPSASTSGRGPHHVANNPSRRWFANATSAASVRPRHTPLPRFMPPGFGAHRGAVSVGVR